MNQDDKQITPAGATELEENALDEASGGLLPAAELGSLKQKKIEFGLAPNEVKLNPVDSIGVKLNPADSIAVKLTGGR